MKIPNKLYKLDSFKLIDYDHIELVITHKNIYLCI